VNMKIEIDYNMRDVARWAFISYIIIAAIAAICFISDGYRTERKYALEHGLIPQTTVIHRQPMLMDEYTKSNTIGDFKPNDWLTK